MANYDPNTLRGFADKNKYQIEYDDKTKNVKMFNPTNNASISFRSGIGKHLGIGKFEGGMHYVTDENKLMGLMNPTQPMTPTQPEYDTNTLNSIAGMSNTNTQKTTPTPSPINANVMEGIQQIMGATPESAYRQKQTGYIDQAATPFQFDANNPTYKAALEYATNQAIQSMTQRGMGYSNLTHQQIAQNVARLMPEFAAQGLREHQANTANQFGAADRYGNLDETDYGRAKYAEAETYGRDKYAEETAYNRSQTAEADRNKYEEAQFGGRLNEETRGLLDNYAKMNTDTRNAIQPYQNDYAAKINEILADPNHPERHLLDILYAARAFKILSNPELRRTYGADYGLVGQGVTDYADSSAMNKADIESKTLANIIKKAEAGRANEILDLEIQKIKQEIESGKLKITEQQILNSALPDKIKKELTGSESGSNTKPVTPAQKKEYTQESINEINDSNINMAVDSITAGTEYYKENNAELRESMGAEGYAKFVKAVQDKYYDYLKSNNEGQDNYLLKQLQGNLKDTYRNKLGTTNYNKLVADLKKSLGID